MIRLDAAMVKIPCPIVKRNMTQNLGSYEPMNLVNKILTSLILAAFTHKI